MAHVDDELTAEDVTMDVVRAVADRKGVEPTDIDERLYDAVDAEALARLFAGTDRGRVTFEFAGVSVEVTAAGDVTTR